MLFRLEDLCVDHVMQMEVIWVKGAGHICPFLLLSLVSALRSSSKINMNKGIIVKGLDDLFCAVFVVTWFQGTVPLNISCY